MKIQTVLFTYMCFYGIVRLIKKTMSNGIRYKVIL